MAWAPLFREIRVTRTAALRPARRGLIDNTGNAAENRARSERTHKEGPPLRRHAGAGACGGGTVIVGRGRGSFDQSSEARDAGEAWAMNAWAVSQRVARMRAR